MAHYNVSKRDWLASLTNPDTGKPYAIANSRGRFSAAAEAVAAGHTFTEPVKAPAAPAAPKAVSLVKAAPKPAAVKATAPDSTVYDAADVRAWGRANGFVVGDRGRFHRDLLTAYAASDNPVTRTVKAPKPVETLAEAQAIKPGPPRAAVIRKVDAVRPERVAYFVDKAKGNAHSDKVVGLSQCGANHAISHCTCKTMLSSAGLGSVPLTLVKPVV